VKLAAVVVLAACGAGHNQPAPTPHAPTNVAEKPAAFVVTLGDATAVMGDELLATLKPDGTFWLGDKPIEGFLVKPDGTIENSYAFYQKLRNLPDEGKANIPIGRLTTDGAQFAKPSADGAPPTFEPIALRFTGDSVRVELDKQQVATAAIGPDGTLRTDPAMAQPIRITAADAKVRSTMFRLLMVVPMAQVLHTKASLKP
jgi:hypothetical protein